MSAYTDGIKAQRSRMTTSLRQATRGEGRLTLLSLLMAVLVLLGVSAQVIADEGPQSAESPRVMSAPPVSDMRAVVRKVEGQQDRIVLTVGSSSVVELSEPMTRAQVADPELVDVAVLSPRQLLVTSKIAGHTQLIIWDLNNEQMTMSVVVETDLTDLIAMIARVAPGSAVEARAFKDTVLLTGTVPDTDTATRIVALAEAFSPKVENQLKVAGVQQVLLRCTIAEVNKRAVRQLGVNGWIAGDNLRDVFAVNQLDQINPVNIGAAPLANIIRPGGLPFATDNNGLVLQPTPTFSLGFPRVQMQLFFQALRENTLLRVLAEPNLVALSGQEASFLVGGEFPVPIPQGIGDTITIEFKEYGIRLSFTPTVIGRQMVRLNIAPEVSEPDFTTSVQFAGFVIPGLTQRRAQTTVELASGTTIAMAGLLSESVRGTARKLPGLGDVPILGSLFSSVNYQKNVTELVILVTPELVGSMQPDQVAPVPGQFMTDPNDYELFGLGLVEGEPMPEARDDNAALETDIVPRYRKFHSPPTQMSLHGPWGQAEASETVQ